MVERLFVGKSLVDEPLQNVPRLLHLATPLISPPDFIEEPTEVAMHLRHFSRGLPYLPFGSTARNGSTRSERLHGVVGPAGLAFGIS